WSWSRLRRSVGLATAPKGPEEDQLARGFGRLLDLDDPEWISLGQSILSCLSPPDVVSLPDRQLRILTALHFSIWGTSGPATLAESLARIWRNNAVRLEILELLAILESESRHLPIP